MRKTPEKTKCPNFKRLEQGVTWYSETVLLTWANPFSTCELDLNHEALCFRAPKKRSTSFNYRQLLADASTHFGGPLTPT